MLMIHHIYGKELFKWNTNFPPEEIRNQRQKIDEIFLAIPSLTKSNKRIIVQKLKNLNLRIFEIPSIEELSERKMDINILRPISIEELLGRIYSSS